MRGRRPKPTVLKLADITHRRRNEREPQPTLGAPEPPAWLSPAARAEWERVAPELARMNLLTRVDVAALAGYATTYAHFIETERAIQEDGLSAGKVAVLCKLSDKIRAFAAEFGFSPSARSRIEAPTSNAKEILREELERQIGEIENNARKA